MASVFLAAALVALPAQESGGANSGTDTAAERPAETELLLNQDDGAAAVAPEEADAPLPGVGFGDFARMFFVLALVIALIYLFIWFLKKFTGQKAESEEIINLLSTRPLKGDAALHLVEVGGSVYLVGSSSNSVSLVAEIDDEDSRNEIRLEASQSPKPVAGSFAKLLQDRFHRGPVPGREQEKPAAAEEDPASFLKSQKERLKDL